MPGNDRVEGEIILTRITNMQSIVEIDPCFFFPFFLFLKTSGQTEKHAILSPSFCLNYSRRNWSETLLYGFFSVDQIRGIVFT